jgi:hypothetical protein
LIRENYIMRSFVTFSPRQINLKMIVLRMMRWIGHAECMRKTHAYRDLMGKPELEKYQQEDGRIVFI